MAILPIRPLKYKVGDTVLCSTRRFIGKIRDTMQSDVYGNVYFINPYDEFKEEVMHVGECNEYDTYFIADKLAEKMRSIKKSINDDTSLRQKICDELCENATKDIKERFSKNQEILTDMMKKIILHNAETLKEE